MKRLGKKGALGFDTAKGVIVALLVLSVLTIAAYVALVTLRDAAESAETLKTATIYNETVTLTTSGVNLAYSNPNVRNAVCTISTVTNETGDYEVVSTANYSTANDGCKLVGAAAGSYNDFGINVTYSVTYNSQEPYNLVSNVTYGGTQFFKNVPTFLIILGVVVLILIISIVIRVVIGFGGGSFGRRGGSIEMG